MAYFNPTQGYAFDDYTPLPKISPSKSKSKKIPNVPGMTKSGLKALDIGNLPGAEFLGPLSMGFKLYNAFQGFKEGGVKGAISSVIPGLGSFGGFGKKSGFKKKKMRALRAYGEKIGKAMDSAPRNLPRDSKIGQKMQELQGIRGATRNFQEDPEGNIGTFEEKLTRAGDIVKGLGKITGRGARPSQEGGGADFGEIGFGDESPHVDVSITGGGQTPAIERGAVGSRSLVPVKRQSEQRQRLEKIMEMFA